MAEIDVRDYELYREISIVGDVQVTELIDAVQGNYTLAAPPSLILYDLSEASMRSITPDDLRALSEATQKAAHGRDGGKTAIISPQNLQYGLTRMFTAYAEFTELQFEFGTFKDRAAASEWLGIELVSK